MAKTYCEMNSNEVKSGVFVTIIQWYKLFPIFVVVHYVIRTDVDYEYRENYLSAIMQLRQLVKMYSRLAVEGPQTTPTTATTTPATSSATTTTTSISTPVLNTSTSTSRITDESTKDTEIMLQQHEQEQLMKWIESIQKEYLIGKCCNNFLLCWSYVIS